MSLRLFVTSSRKDESLMRSLLEHLSVLDHVHGVDLWTEDRIRAGHDWHEDVTAAIRRSDIALILVSASYLASSFATNKAFNLLLAELHAGSIKIVPVILRHCAWDEHPVLSKLTPLPRDRVPIAHYTAGRRDKAYLNVCKEIVRLADAEYTVIDTDAARASVPFRELLGAMRRYKSPSEEVAPAKRREDPNNVESPTDLDDIALLAPAKAEAIEHVTLKLVDPSTRNENGVFFTLRTNPTLIGREPPADIIIDDRGVSRQHATIEFVAGRLFLKDLASANGTFCNGQLVGGGTLGNSRRGGEIPLKANDIIRFGSRVHALVLVDNTVSPKRP